MVFLKVLCIGPWCFSWCCALDHGVFHGAVHWTMVFLKVLCIGPWCFSWCCALDHGVSQGAVHWTMVFLKVLCIGPWCFSRSCALDHGAQGLTKYDFVTSGATLSMIAFILVLYSTANRETSDPSGSISGCTDSIMEAKTLKVVTRILQQLCTTLS